MVSIEYWQSLLFPDNPTCVNFSLQASVIAGYVSNGWKLLNRLSGQSILCINRMHTITSCSCHFVVIFLFNITSSSFQVTYLLSQDHWTGTLISMSPALHSKMMSILWRNEHKFFPSRAHQWLTWTRLPEYDHCFQYIRWSIIFTETHLFSNWPYARRTRVAGRRT